MTDQEQFKKLDAGTPVNPDIEAMDAQLSGLARQFEIKPRSEDFDEASEAKPAEILSPKERLEKVLRDNFQGQSSEVTVGRTIKGSKEKRKEGGWEVVGPDAKKEGRVIVSNRKQNIHKSLDPAELLDLQPFKVGEHTPVLVGKEKTLVPNGWFISGKSEIGGYTVVKKEGNGRFASEQVLKSDLIDAKIAVIGATIVELEAQKTALEKHRKSITGFHDWSSGSHSGDNELLDDIDLKLREFDAKMAGAVEEVNYWKSKLETINRIKEESLPKKEKVDPYATNRG